MVKRYKTVPLPEELYKEIQGFIDSHPELGYRSVAEFVRNAARDRLVELKIGLKKSGSGEAHG